MTVEPARTRTLRHPESSVITGVLGALLAITAFSIDISLPALPGIARAFMEPGRVQLVVALFLVGFAVGQLIHGPASDRFGRRPVLLAALGLYVGASLLCLMAPSLAWLAAARLVQGFGACAGPVIARAVVRDVYDPVRGARVLSLAAMAMSLAPIAGSITGGLVVSAWSWRTVFGVLTAFGALLLGAVALLLPETNAREGRTGQAGTTIARDFAGLLQHRGFVGYVLTLAAGSVGLFAWISGSPFVLMTFLGLPPHLYGLSFATVNLGQLGGALLSARLTVRIGIDRTIALGLALYVAGGLVLAVLTLAGVRQAIAVIAPMMVFQLGNGLVMPNTVVGAVAPFPRAAGAASALAGFVQMVAGALSGLAIGRLHDGTGWPMAMLVASSALASTAVFWLVAWPRRR
jgi:DHA1 family bicyclomycin/chloramphenicol resistance-like MFS transporter